MQKDIKAEQKHSIANVEAEMKKKVEIYQQR